MSRLCKGKLALFPSTSNAAIKMSIACSRCPSSQFSLCYSIACLWLYFAECCLELVDPLTDISQLPHTSRHIYKPRKKDVVKPDSCASFQTGKSRPTLRHALSHHHNNKLCPRCSVAGCCSPVAGTDTSSARNRTARTKEAADLQTKKKNNFGRMALQNFSHLAFGIRLRLRLRSARP